MFDLKKGTEILTIEAWDLRRNDRFIHDGTPLKVQNVIQNLDTGGVVVQTVKLRRIHRRYKTLFLPKSISIKVIR